MNRFRLAVLAVMPLALAASAIIPTRHSHAAGYTIAFLPKAIGNPYFDTAFAGGKQAAASDGDTVKQVGPTTADASGQVTYIKSLIQQHVNAIVVSADDPGVIAPSLEQAMAKGIKVVSYDSDTLPAARNVFINQASTEQIGRVEVQILGKLIKYKGEIAILSATSTATNQNAWISFMKKELAKPKYKHMKLDTIVYGNDDPALSTTVAQGLLTKYPKLRGIIAPTTVGIKAAAQVVDVAHKQGKVIVTGLGTPNDMRKYVKNGTVPVFALWNPGNLGYLAETTAHQLAAGTLKPNVGASYKAGMLGERKIGANRVVLLGPPQQFNKSNIDKFHF